MSRNQREPLPRSERGAAMLAALCLAMVFAISLSSYLALCYISLYISTRSIALAHSTELAEAGVEQALYALNAPNNGDWNTSVWSISGGNATANLTMTSSGLVATSSSPTPLNFGNGVTGQVQVTVQNYANYSSHTSPGPSITATSTMTLPAYSGSFQTPTVSSTATYSAPSSPTTAAAPLFVNAVAATTGNVRFASGGTVDSYNSNPSLGTYQDYSATVAGYSAIVLSQNAINISTASVCIGNAVIHGYAEGYNHVSPSSTNWLSYGSSGQIVGPSTPTSTSIDSSRLLTSPIPYQPEFLENLPNNLSSLPLSCSNNGVTINMTSTLGSTAGTVPTVYVAGSGTTPAINLSGSQVLSIQGPVVIICYGNVTISGTAQIQLTTPQASLQIFLEIGNLSLGGNGIANLNSPPIPKKVAIMSTTNVWGSMTISTNQPYYGVIYFPYLTINVTSAAPTICGSIVGASVTFTYSPTIHYDLALRYPMPSYSSLIPLRSGAAFDNLSAPASFSGLVTSVQ